MRNGNSAIAADRGLPQISKKFLANHAMPSLIKQAEFMASDIAGELHIYTDGSFTPATRSGGWAYVVMRAEQQLHAHHGVASGETNNTFEVLAVLQALSFVDAQVRGADVTVWTDSHHVVEGCRHWRAIWRHNGWKRVNPNPRARRRAIPDMLLWQKLDDLLERNSDVSVRWCKGHSGIAANEYADLLAREAETAE
ncbi:RNase HI [Neorhizobium sp. JUb45]|nr:RNase HI [Neorhizobium sp. JUb45]